MRFFFFFFQNSWRFVSILLLPVSHYLHSISAVWFKKKKMHANTLMRNIKLLYVADRFVDRRRPKEKRGEGCISLRIRFASAFLYFVQRPKLIMRGCKKSTSPDEVQPKRTKRGASFEESLIPVLISLHLIHLPRSFSQKLAHRSEEQGPAPVWVTLLWDHSGEIFMLLEHCDTHTHTHPATYLQYLCSTSPDTHACLDLLERF